MNHGNVKNKVCHRTERRASAYRPTNQPTTTTAQQLPSALVELQQLWPQVFFFFFFYDKHNKRDVIVVEQIYSVSSTEQDLFNCTRVKVFIILQTVKTVADRDDFISFVWVSLRMSHLCWRSPPTSGARGGIKCILTILTKTILSCLWMDRKSTSFRWIRMHTEEQSRGGKLQNESMSNGVLRERLDVQQRSLAGIKPGIQCLFGHCVQHILQILNNIQHYPHLGCNTIQYIYLNQWCAQGGANAQLSKNAC